MFLGRLLVNPLPGESVIIKLRRHWFIFFRQVVIYVFWLILPFILGYLSLRFAPNLWDRAWSGGFLTMLFKLAISYYFLALWMFFWNAWTDYYLDVWFVTNERLLSFEQKGLFNRQISELRLSRVQDVSVQVKGLLSTVFGFGQLYVQTAGAEERFFLRDVPQPYRVADKIIRLADTWRQQHPAG